MFEDQKIYLSNDIYMHTDKLNRHGLITGATGTGKTVSLKLIIEQLSEQGINTFVADIKGDVSGLAAKGTINEGIQKRIDMFGLDTYENKSFPVTFWDVYGEKGIPVRTTVSNMGPLMLSQLMDLNDTQTAVLMTIFKAADAEGLPILDFKDLKAIVKFAQENRKELEKEYGLMSSQSISAIMRSLIYLEEQGIENLFGEPALEINDWFRDEGMVHILHAVKLFQSPSLYASFLLWMLSDLYEVLPEVGDLDKPKMVFFFDEAHLLFKDMPKVLMERLELVIKLIRSKGVSIFFITQNPRDIPDSVLSQLGNRIQHALRAYTPSEQKSLKAAADSFRPNPNFDTAEAISSLKTGEALVSVLDDDGQPSVVERVYIYPPRSYMGEIDLTLRNQLIQSSQYERIYRNIFDRESAYEILLQREIPKELEKEIQKPVKKKTSNRMTPLERSINSAFSSMGRELGRNIMRGVMGTLTGKK